MIFAVYRRVARLGFAQTHRVLDSPSYYGVFLHIGKCHFTPDGQVTRGFQTRLRQEDIVDGNLIRCPRKLCGYCGIARARISVHAHLLLLGLGRVLVTPIRHLVALGTFAVVDHR